MRKGWKGERGYTACEINVIIPDFQVSQAFVNPDIQNPKRPDRGTKNTPKFLRTSTLLIVWCDTRNCIIKTMSYVMQARVFTPFMFIEQHPQMPSRQDLLKDNVGSCCALINVKISSTIVPHLFKSTLNCCMYGFTFGISGFHRYTRTICDLDTTFCSCERPVLNNSRV